MTNWIPFAYIASGVLMGVTAVIWYSTLTEYRQIKRMGFAISTAPAIIAIVLSLLAAIAYLTLGVALWRIN